MLASVTATLTDWVGNHGVYAVFALMALDAVFPVGGELVMLYAGALASGAIAGTSVAFFGASLSSGLETYLVLSLAGTLGYLCGALVGWAIGRYGGRPLLERRGRWLHLGPERVARAERWFDRHGRWAVFLGRLTPIVRSFISIPAGAFGSPLRTYVPLTLLGSAIWCFAFAGAGWALGSGWEQVHKAFDLVEVAAVAGLIALAALLVWRARSGRRAGTNRTRINW
jgi:membrane protein DedA with SNARE-associated domain